MMNIKKLKTGVVVLLALVSVMLPVSTMAFGVASAVTTAPSSGGGGLPGDVTTTQYQCGSGVNAVYTSINICGTTTSTHIPNPILDAAFAIIKLLTDGVGLVVVASLVYAGIQYSASAGDPQAAAKATGRIRQSVIALLIFIFGFAILNYIIPAGFLK